VEERERAKVSVSMYLWSPLFLAHLGHFLKTYETPSLSPLVLERN